MYQLPDSVFRFAALMMVAAVVTSFYCGPAAIVGVVVGLVFVAHVYSRLNL